MDKISGDSWADTAMIVGGMMMKGLSLDADFIGGHNDGITDAIQNWEESDDNCSSEIHKDIAAVQKMIANHKVVKETEEFGLPQLLRGLRKDTI